MPDVMFAQHHDPTYATQLSPVASSAGLASPLVSPAARPMVPAAAAGAPRATPPHLPSHEVLSSAAASSAGYVGASEGGDDGTTTTSSAAATAVVKGATPPTAPATPSPLRTTSTPRARPGRGRDAVPPLQLGSSIADTTVDGSAAFPSPPMAARRPRISSVGSMNSEGSVGDVLHYHMDGSQAHQMFANHSRRRTAPRYAELLGGGCCTQSRCGAHHTTRGRGSGAGAMCSVAAPSCMCRTATRRCRSST